MENNKVDTDHSKKNIISYNFGSLGREFTAMAFAILVFFYYEVEIGLNVWLIGLGLVLFAVYNAINDPLVGYLTNRPFKFTKKWGRRFPWMLLGGLPLGFSYFLIFIPPRVDPESGAWIIFAWLVFTTCLFDTFHSIFFVSYQALFPDKFRSLKERRTVMGFQVILGAIGVALGSILPPLLINFGDLDSYVFQGFVVFLLALIFFIFAIPGWRENQEMIDKYLATAQEKVERESFIKTMKIAFKQKSFVAYIVLYTMYFAMINSMQNSLIYFVRFILKMPAGATAPIMAGFLLGAMISTPFWIKWAQKTNDNRKIMLIASILLGIFVLPLAFIEDYFLIVIILIIWGLALGGYWAMIFPTFSDVIDESIVLHEKREEGTYIGIQQFFGRLGLIIQVMSFTLIHSLTGFVEGSDTQTPLALWGIHIHTAIVPMVCIFIGAFVFWKWYDLTPDKVIENQQKIKELKL
jgi:GPH family glycoside/pentoside/hexuronide:cation symporter